jgi:hypothetical protein
MWWRKRKEMQASQQPSDSTLLDPVELWRRIVLGEEKSWVLFEHGTCVILMQSEQDLAAQATEILRQWGPVAAGTPAGDFDVITLSEFPGWVVTGHHPDVLNYVGPEEAASHSRTPLDVVVGIAGRSKRDRDGRELRVRHIEDRRRAIWRRENGGGT